MRVNVDSKLCVGTGLCESICPEVFQLQDGVSRVKADPVPVGLENACREAVENCPAAAIIENDQGKAPAT